MIKGIDHIGIPVKSIDEARTCIFPPTPSLRLAADIVEFCAQEVPGRTTSSGGGYHVRERGCTAAQGIAFTLADGIACVQTCVGRRMAEFAEPGAAPQSCLFAVTGPAHGQTIA